MDNYIPVGVLGTDNVSPLYNPNANFRIWNMNEIYLGQIGENKYVPKVNDLVIEIAGRQITNYIVQSIDPSTFVPTLVSQDVSNLMTNLTEIDYLLGVGPGTQSDTYRVYVDKSVNPYRLNVDRRCFIGTAAYCKIFRASVLSDDGEVVSGIYNEFGVLLSENIPCVLVARDNFTNHDIRVVGDGFTTADLQDGQVVVAVFYTNDGAVISKRQLLVENTGFVRQTDSRKKYISSIELDTPFLSNIDNRLIQYPINVPLNSANLIGIVNYSDGSRSLLPIDGSKFSILGLENYTATIVGQTSNLVLKYTLGPNEEALDVHVGTDTFITKSYSVVAIAKNGHYGVQLYAYPSWVNPITGYTLKWFMYDLDRSASYDVTNNVIINTNITPFNPLGYGIKQSLNVSVNLRSVNGSYNDFNHVQIVDVTLIKQGIGRPDIDSLPNWTTSTVSNQGTVYGDDVYATYTESNPTTYLVRLGREFTTFENWLEGLYLNTMPLFDPGSEIEPIAPSHFIISVNGVEFTYSISQWNANLTVTQPLANNMTLFVKFIKRVGNTDLELSIAGMSLYLVDSTGLFI